jgi:tetratricopeptide (TPR) repeat protein
MNTLLTKGLLRRLGFGALAILTLAGAFGCRRSVAVQDAEERDRPALQKARGAWRQNDADRAIQLYRDILDEEPRLALAHMDYALILHDAKKDYLGAIYHYRRYLELRPQSEKLAIIQNRLRLAQQLFAAQAIPQDPQMADKVRLAQENESLRGEVARLKQDLEAATRLAASPVVSHAETGRAFSVTQPVSEGVAVKPPSVSQPPRTYKVRAGDTLSSIATEFYNDRTRWTRIAEANRRTLGGSTNLKPGQVLTIP